MISYAHKDMDAMRILRDLFHAHNLTTWVDEDCLGPGSQFFAEIGDAIGNSTVFVVLLSPAMAHSQFCKNELSLAYMTQANPCSVDLPRHPDMLLSDSPLAR